MRNFMVTWIVLAIVLIAFAQLNFDLTQVPGWFSTLSAVQKFMTITAAVMALSLLASAVWQALELSRQSKALKVFEERLDGFRHAATLADNSQRDVEAVVQNVTSSDPEKMIASLQKRLTESEHRIGLQKGRNAAADMQERLDEIRRQQQVLRDRLGEVIIERKAVEPIFGELKERQANLEQSLADVEDDDDQNDVTDRLNELEGYVSQTRAKLKVLQDTLVTLARSKEELTKSQADLVPLMAPDAGIAALNREVQALRDQLIKAVDGLESDGDEKLTTRLETLSNSKKDVEDRVQRLGDCFTTLDSIRRDLGELNERQALLERSFAAVETDSNGKTLADHLKELSDFATQTRSRLWVLQETLTTLNGHKEEMTKTQSDLAPLLAPDTGIAALSGQVHTLRDQLTKVIGGLETDGDEKLAVRVTALSKSKVEIERRIKDIEACFENLDAIRTGVSGLFTKLNTSLKKHM